MTKRKEVSTEEAARRYAAIIERRKRYYKKNAERLKAYQRDRYHKMMEAYRKQKGEK